MRGCLGCLGQLLVLGCVVAGGLYYFLGTDLPPVQLALPSAEDLPLIGAAEQPRPDPNPESVAYTDALLSEGLQVIATQRATALEIMRTLQAAGLPVTGAALETTADGRRALLLLAPYSGSLVGLGSSGLAGGFQALLRLAERGDVPLEGIDELVLTLQDREGRTLFALAAPASTITAFRAGQATRAELIRSMAVKAESRAGILDAVGQEVGS